MDFPAIRSKDDREEKGFEYLMMAAYEYPI